MTVETDLPVVPLSPAVVLPTEAAVREHLTGCLGTPVAVRYDAEPRLRPDRLLAVARYVDDTGTVRALLGCDLRVGAALATALALLPPVRGSEAVDAGRLPADLLANLHEVLNMTAGLLNGPDRPHLTLGSIVDGAELRGSVAGELCEATERLDLTVDVPGHAGGALALVVPGGRRTARAESSGPGLEDTRPGDETQRVTIPAPQPAAPAGVGPDAFDFEAPLPLPATAPRLVSRVQDVSPRIGVALSVACGRTVGVTCTGAERVSASHLAGSGMTWAYVDCGVFGAAVLAVPAALTVVLADTLMGGSGRLDDDRPGRSATTLEQRLVLRHLGPALQPLVTAFSANGLSALVVGEPEQLAPPTSIGDLVALRLRTRIEGSGVEDTVTLALPARALLPGSELALAQPSTATAAALGAVPVQISLRLASTPMSAADLESLSPGDVVRLDHAVDQPLLGVLDDRVVLQATLGRRGRRRAVLVTDLLGGSA